MSSCGLRHKRRGQDKGKGKECVVVETPSSRRDSQEPDGHPNLLVNGRREILQEFKWARDDQLSIILESLEGSRITPNSSRTLLQPAPHSRPLIEQNHKLREREKLRERQQDKQPKPKSPHLGFSISKPSPSLKATSNFNQNPDLNPNPNPNSNPTRTPIATRNRNLYLNLNPNQNLVTNFTTRTPSYKKTRFRSRDSFFQEYEPLLRMSERGSSSIPPSRTIQPPPRDLDSISRIDASLVFEHFTTTDAWELGSSLRNRLLPLPTPAVINISLANQSQTVFHSVTHSGVMPDNESWVARKRNTVLRWGCSTWFMSCKFAGDESAFREKYGLGESASEYAIHGGGVPIRVTGVEGVVAVVIVSGLKQDENHAVIVEVIKDLYY